MERVHREDAEEEVVQRQDSGFAAVHAGALILLFASVALAPWLTRTAGLHGFVATYAVALGAWLVARRAALSRPAVIAIAIGLRLPLLFAEPALSTDVYRYLWDGRVLRSGTNPYALAPDAPQLAALRDSWHSQINHAEIRTIYPPVAELLFALAPSLLVWRLLVIAAEMLAIVLLRERGLAYAAFPLAIFEGAWGGHLDVIAGVLVLLAFMRLRPSMSGAAASLKVIPAVAIPAMIAAAPRRWRAVAVVAAVILVPALPFLAAGPVMPGMSDYASRWSFNSPAYDAAVWLTSQLDLKPLWGAAKDALHLEAISDVVYRHLYPAFLARALSGGILVLVLLRVWRDPLASIAALLLLSPTIHPWYWCVLVPLAFARDARWLAFAACAPASYLLYERWPAWVVAVACYGVGAWTLARDMRFRSDA